MIDELHPKRRFGTTSRLVAALALGVACGLFFGPHCGWLSWVGQAYIGLLQMTVLPFVVVSLVANVGRMSRSQGGRLARVSTFILLSLWAVGLASVLLMTNAFPPWAGGSHYGSARVAEPEPTNWLEMFIPSNPFWSMTHNLVPAVVVFSLGLGYALAGSPKKPRVIELLDVAVETLGLLNRMVVRLAPLGIFAITAHTSGVTPFDEFALMQGYLLAYGAAAVLLSLVLLPAAVSCCTPFSYREVLGASRDALITAFVIGNTFVVLPMIVDSVQKLFAKHRIQSADSHMPEFVVPLAYPFPDLGRIVGLLFVPFAAWFYGQTIDSTQYPAIMALGVVGSFAKPVVTVPLLLQTAELPGDIFDLYIAVGVVTSRFGDLMKGAHLIAFAVLTSTILAGAARFRWRKLAVRGVAVAAVGVLAVVSIRMFLLHVFEDAYAKEDLIAARPLAFEPAEYHVYAESKPLEDDDDDREEETIQRVRRTKVLRVGYTPQRIPFSYINSDGDLVGFDVDMMHLMAHDLGVKVEFYPVGSNITRELSEGRYDLAVGGIEGTVRRAGELPIAQHYLELTSGFVVRDSQTQRFRRMSDVLALKDVKFAVVRNSLASELPRRLFPNAEFVEIDSKHDFFSVDPPPADALLTSVEVGSAWVLQYPEYSVIRPKGMRVQVPLYYYSSPHEHSMEEFLETWQTLKFLDGSRQQLYDYWILGKSLRPDSPRWYILRDVLHWVD